MTFVVDIAFIIVTADFFLTKWKQFIVSKCKCTCKFISLVAMKNKETKLISL